MLVDKIRFDPLNNEFSIELATAPATQGRFPTQGDAELALIEHEREAWEIESKRPQGETHQAAMTLKLLKEIQIPLSERE